MQMPARTILTLALFVGFTAMVQGDDWPHWMGPHRDNTWREEGLLEKFPEGGPRIVWRVPIAGGYSGPAVVGGKLYVQDYVADGKADGEASGGQQATGVERVLCLDAETGEELWRHAYPVAYNIDYSSGPRCTPTVDGDRVYTLGAMGHLICLNAETGDVIWRHHLPTRYHTKTAIWGYASHPLVDGEKLISVAGGQDSHAVAFNKHTGEEIWRALTSPEQGYAPPAILEIAGERQLVLFRPNAVTAIDPESGREYWSAPFDADNGLVVMTPVLWKDHLFVGGYSNKNMLLKLAADGRGAEVVWRGNARHGISPVNVQPSLQDDTLFGFDHDNGRLYAMEMATGNRLWETIEPLADAAFRRPIRAGTAFLVRQGENGDRYWLFTENGDLIIARLTPRAYEEIDRTHLLEPTSAAFGREVLWCMPAFTNRRMYVRNDKECIAVDLADRQ